MAETLLEDEVEILILKNRIHLPDSDSNSESDTETWDEDYTEWEYENPVTIKENWRDYLPYLGENIVDYPDADFYEACSYIGDDEGDPDELGFDDLDQYLSESCNSIRNFDSVSELARAAADYKIINDLENDREYLLRYYAINYYLDTVNTSSVPTELVEHIEDADYWGMDSQSDVEQMVDEWIDDYEGLRSYLETRTEN